MAWEAYSVAVKISLINNVSSGLLLLSRHFNTADKDAKQLQKTIDRIRTIGLAGAAIAGIGFMGLGIFAKALKPAEEYVHQLNIMNMAGLKQKEIAEATGAAWETSSKIITTTATENLRTLLDLRNILGDIHEAHGALPVVSRAQAVFQASTSKAIASNSQEFSYGMAKALDIIGAAQNKQRFEHEAELMSKAIIATQGRVTPMAMQSVFQYGRQAKYGWNDEFKYEILPTLIQEYAAGKGSAGGGSRGVGPMLAAFYRMTVQGYINKKALPELQSLGLVDANTALKTTTSGTTVGAMKNWQLAMQNPFLWVQQILVPAIKKKYGENITPEQLLFHINQITRGNQLASALAGEFAIKPINFERDQRNIRKTKSTAEAYEAAIKNDPQTAHLALKAQWDNAKTGLFMSAVPLLVPIIVKASEFLNKLAIVFKENPTLTKTLVVIGGIILGLTTLGGMLLIVKSGLGALGLVGGLKTVIGVLTGTGGLINLLGKGLNGACIMAAGGIGYLIGTLLNSSINEFVKWVSNGKYDSPGAWFYDFMHDPKKPGGSNVWDDMYEKDRINTVAPGSKTAQHSHNAILQVDGRTLGQVTLKEITKEGSRPINSISDFDWSMNAVPQGYSGK